VNKGRTTPPLINLVTLCQTKTEQYNVQYIFASLNTKRLVRYQDVIQQTNYFTSLLYCFSCKLEVCNK